MGYTPSGCGVSVAYLRNPLKEKHSHVGVRVMEWKTTENRGNFKQRTGLYCFLCYNQRRPRRLFFVLLQSPYEDDSNIVNQTCNIVYINTRMPVTLRKHRAFWAVPQYSLKPS